MIYPYLVLKGKDIKCELLQHDFCDLLKLKSSLFILNIYKLF